MKTQIKSSLISQVAAEEGFESTFELLTLKAWIFFFLPCGFSCIYDPSGNGLKLNQELGWFFFLSDWEYSSLVEHLPIMYHALSLHPKIKGGLDGGDEYWKTEHDIINTLQSPHRDQLFPGNLTQQSKKHSERDIHWDHPRSLYSLIATKPSCPSDY